LFVTDGKLRKQLSEGVAKVQEDFSMARFFERLTEQRSEKAQ
jgi:hypothetical protein